MKFLGAKTVARTLSQLKIKRAWISYRLRVYRRAGGDVFYKNMMMNALERELPPLPDMNGTDFEATQQRLRST